MVKNEGFEKFVRRVKNTAGYTMFELLVVIAIVGILSGFGFVAILKYRKDMKLSQMDNTAKQLFIAAQNHMTAKRVSGDWDSYYSDVVNRNSTLDSSGNSVINEASSEVLQKLGTKMPSTVPSDYPGSDADYASTTHDYRYFVVDSHSADTFSNASRLQNNTTDCLLDYIFPYGSVEETSRTGNAFVIEYDAKTASVYAVFYTDGKNGLDYGDVSVIEAANARGDSDNAKSYRRDKFKKNNDQCVVGYYGGTEAIQGNNTTLNLPGGMTVTNGNRLEVSFTDLEYFKTVGTDMVHATPVITVKGAVSGHQKTIAIPLNHSTSTSNAPTINTSALRGVTENVISTPVLYNLSAEERAAKKDPSDPDVGVKYTITLDAIDIPGGHFADIFASDTDAENNLIPGEDVIVTVELQSSTVLANIPTDYRTVNSLFETVTKNGTTSGSYEVSINNGRNLQNLASEISGVATNATSAFYVTKAVVTDDIDWNSFFGNNADNTDTKSYPYDNAADSYQRHGMVYKKGETGANPMPVGGAGTVGRFYSMINDQLIEIDGNNHILKNLNIAANDTGNAGLIAQTGADGSNNISQNMTIKNLVLTNPIVTGAGGGTSAGAFVGIAGNETILENVGAIALTKADYESGTFNANAPEESSVGNGPHIGNGTGAAGGLVGATKMNAANLIIKNAVAAIPVSINSGNAGGVVGSVQKGATANLIDIYVGTSLDDTKGDMLFNDSSISVAATGGIAGGVIGYSESPITATAVESFASAHGQWAGGFIGYSKDDDARADGNQFTNMVIGGRVTSSVPVNNPAENLGSFAGCLSNKGKGGNPVANKVNIIGGLSNGTVEDGPAFAGDDMKVFQIGTVVLSDTSVDLSDFEDTFKLNSTSGVLDNLDTVNPLDTSNKYESFVKNWLQTETKASDIPTGKTAAQYADEKFAEMTADECYQMMTAHGFMVQTSARSNFTMYYSDNMPSEYLDYTSTPYPVPQVLAGYEGLSTLGNTELGRDHADRDETLDGDREIAKARFNIIVGDWPLVSRQKVNKSVLGKILTADEMSKLTFEFSDKNYPVEDGFKTTSYSLDTFDLLRSNTIVVTTGDTTQESFEQYYERNLYIPGTNITVEENQANAEIDEYILTTQIDDDLGYTKDITVDYATGDTTNDYVNIYEKIPERQDLRAGFFYYEVVDLGADSQGNSRTRVYFNGYTYDITKSYDDPTAYEQFNTAGYPGTNSDGLLSGMYTNGRTVIEDGYLVVVPKKAGSKTSATRFALNAFGKGADGSWSYDGGDTTFFHNYAPAKNPELANLLGFSEETNNIAYYMSADTLYNKGNTKVGNSVPYNAMKYGSDEWGNTNGTNPGGLYIRFYDEDSVSKKQNGNVFDYMDPSNKSNRSKKGAVFAFNPYFADTISPYTDKVQDTAKTIDGKKTYEVRSARQLSYLFNDFNNANNIGFLSKDRWNNNYNSHRVLITASIDFGKACRDVDDTKGVSKETYYSLPTIECMNGIIECDSYTRTNGATDYYALRNLTNPFIKNGWTCTTFKNLQIDGWNISEPTSYVFMESAGEYNGVNPVLDNVMLKNVNINADMNDKGATAGNGIIAQAYSTKISLSVDGLYVNGAELGDNWGIIGCVQNDIDASVLTKLNNIHINAKNPDSDFGIIGTTGYNCRNIKNLTVDNYSTNGDGFLYQTPANQLTVDNVTINATSIGKNGFSSLLQATDIINCTVNADNIGKNGFFETANATSSGHKVDNCKVVARYKIEGNGFYDSLGGTNSGISVTNNAVEARDITLNGFAQKITNVSNHNTVKAINTIGGDGFANEINAASEDNHVLGAAEIKGNGYATLLPNGGGGTATDCSVVADVIDGVGFVYETYKNITNCTVQANSEIKSNGFVFIINNSGPVLKDNKVTCSGQIYGNGFATQILGGSIINSDVDSAAIGGYGYAENIQDNAGINISDIEIIVRSDIGNIGVNGEIVPRAGFADNLSHTTVSNVTISAPGTIYGDGFAHYVGYEKVDGGYKPWPNGSVSNININGSEISKGNGYASNNCIELKDSKIINCFIADNGLIKNNYANISNIDMVNVQISGQAGFVYNNIGGAIDNCHMYGDLEVAKTDKNNRFREFYQFEDNIDTMGLVRVGSRSVNHSSRQDVAGFVFNEEKYAKGVNAGLGLGDENNNHNATPSIKNCSITGKVYGNSVAGFVYNLESGDVNGSYADIYINSLDDVAGFVMNVPVENVKDGTFTNRTIDQNHVIGVIEANNNGDATSNKAGNKIAGFIMNMNAGKGTSTTVTNNYVAYSMISGGDKEYKDQYKEFIYTDNVTEAGKGVVKNNYYYTDQLYEAGKGRDTQLPATIGNVKNAKASYVIRAGVKPDGAAAATDEVLKNSGYVEPVGKTYEDMKKLVKDTTANSGNALGIEADDTVKYGDLNTDPADVQYPFPMPAQTHTKGTDTKTQYKAMTQYGDWMMDPTANVNVTPNTAAKGNVAGETVEGDHLGAQAAVTAGSVRVETPAQIAAEAAAAETSTEEVAVPESVKQATKTTVYEQATVKTGAEKVAESVTAAVPTMSAQPLTTPKVQLAQSAGTTSKVSLSSSVARTTVTNAPLSKAFAKLNIGQGSVIANNFVQIDRTTLLGTHVDHSKLYITL